MTQIAKLYRRFAEGRSLSFAELQRLLEALGFRLDRVHGSHHVYKRDGVAERMVVVPKGKAALPYQLRELRAIVEEYGLKLDDAE